MDFARSIGFIIEHHVQKPVERFDLPMLTDRHGRVAHLSGKVAQIIADLYRTRTPGAWFCGCPSIRRYNNPTRRRLFHCPPLCASGAAGVREKK